MSQAIIGNASHRVDPASPVTLHQLHRDLKDGPIEHLPLAESLAFHFSEKGSKGFFAKQVRRRFQDLLGGRVNVIDQTGSFCLTGDENTKDRYDDDLLQANVYVSDPGMYRRVMTGGTIGAAESYMEGQWSTDHLTNLIRIMIRNLDHFTRLERSWAWVKNAWHFLQHSLRHNSIQNSKQNIYEHYDLGNQFYELFLDPTLNYSSGIFTPETLEAGHDQPAAHMHDASLRKMDEICRKLELSSIDHVLEIGSGWGAMACYMASAYGCRVTTTTISKAQHELALKRVRAAGLEDKVTVLLQDYRDLQGSYDKIVSVEMIEAVGHQYYDQFFTKCNQLLRDDGAMLLQAITIGEQNYEYHIRHVDFIGKYIFPGGSLPSVSALTRSVGRVSKMRMLRQEDITPHYARTLELWRVEFLRKLSQVRAQGFDEAFIRRWHFYLCYCEAAFHERRVHCTHLMFAKPKCKIDPAIRSAVDEV